MAVQSYDSAVADSATAGLASTKAALEASLAELTGYVNRVKSAWDGDEMTLYANVQQQWDTAAKNVQTILDQIHTGLGKNTESVGTMRSQVRTAVTGG